MVAKNVGLSIVLCSCNGDSFILSQLESLPYDCFDLNEICISDDCSSDSTIQILENWVGALKSKSPHIKVLFSKQDKQLGVSKNFELTLNVASGPWIFLADQDDVWAGNKTALFKRAIQEFTGPGVINSDGDLVDEEMAPLGQTLFQSLSVTSKEKRLINNGFAYKVLLRRNLYTGAAMAVHREVVNEATPFPTRWMHDEWLAITSAFLFSNLLIDMPTFAYRQHSGNLIGAKSLTLRNKISKYREPREERNINLYHRAKVLYEFAVANNWETKSHVPDVLQLLERNRAFHYQRLVLPVRRIQRLLFVARLYLGGDYNTFSLGLRDAIRDITQPAPMGKLSEETQFKSITK